MWLPCCERKGRNPAPRPGVHRQQQEYTAVKGIFAWMIGIPIPIIIILYLMDVF
jgi:hypothetical protein